jgi:hypothetical protein
VTENTTTGTITIGGTVNGTATIGGVVLLPNSIYVSVAGGSPASVATAIWSKKAPGCGYNGNTTITVFDANSGYNAPLPSYQVTYQIPTPLPIVFNVSVLNNSSVPSDAEAQVGAAIVNAFAGGDGGPRARIGSSLLASRYYSPVQSLGSWVNLLNIQVGSTNDIGSPTFTGSLSSGTLTVTGTVSGTLTAGMFLFDAGGSLTEGTMIVSQVSGSVGGTGKYLTTNNLQTIAAEPMQGVAAIRSGISVPISQIPTVTAALVNLILVTAPS